MNDYMACRIIKTLDDGKPFLFQFGAKHLLKFRNAMESVMIQRPDWGIKDLSFNVGGNFTIDITDEQRKRGGRQTVFCLSRKSKKNPGKMSRFSMGEDVIEPLYDALYYVVKENGLDKDKSEGEKK